MTSLQKPASVHVPVYNHFNLERHMIFRHTYMLRRAATLLEGNLIAA